MDIQAIVKRTKNIIVNPIGEWEIIKAESPGKNNVLKNFVLPYVVVIGIAALIGSAIFHSRFGFSISYIITSSIISMIMAFAGVYLSALLINELAPSFDSVKNSDNSFSYVAYSFTAYFVATAVSDLLDIYPLNILISLAGLYSFYILWLGATPMMSTPEEKKAGFVIVSALIIIGVYAVLSIILGLLFSGVLVASGLNSIM
ncbi:MAG: Yip1 family protein [Bacteroidales bacterium]